ncbi:hypothetical protein [Arthrobacter pityocampae]|uniref:hypothetical protein n=1 Tax=Arthrobacter pityocampae TaxID=547334 RepID=UPI0011B05AA8|nr:hypothetical protein [Arthrobacter pityocampae]
MRATGDWIEYRGHLYPITSHEPNFEIRYFGVVPPDSEWARRKGSDEQSGGLAEYTKIISAGEVTRRISLKAKAVWDGTEFNLMGFDANGNAWLLAYVPGEIALALVAGKHSWEMFDRSSVSGRVPVSELTDVSETMRELPLPRA